MTSQSVNPLVRAGTDSGESITSRLQAVEKGLPFNVFDQLRQDLDLPRVELAGLIQISLRTLNRRKVREYFSPTESERLNRFKDILKLAINVLEDENQAKQWLKSPVGALGGNIPLIFAKHESGAREVFDLLSRIEHGVFS